MKTFRFVAVVGLSIALMYLIATTQARLLPSEPVQIAPNVVRVVIDAETIEIRTTPKVLIEVVKKHNLLTEKSSLEQQIATAETRIVILDEMLALLE